MGGKSAAGAGPIVDACARVSKDVVVSLTSTPHDFYAGFPDNPRIGRVNGNPQWVEFDSWGQFFGLGLFPAIVLDDMRERFRHCAANGVTGTARQLGASLAPLIIISASPSQMVS